MLVIGLTGGIASGKSFVAECFAELGCEVVNADLIGHQVLKLPETIERIQEAFGAPAVVDGEVDRRVLASIVFPKDSDAPSKELKLLESITHPEIGNWMKLRFLEIEQSNSAKAIVLDAPVMFKAQWDRFCDRIVFVHADLEIRQQRANLRGWPEGELRRRERQQLPLEQKRKFASDEIENSGSADQTREQVQSLWMRWQLRDWSSEFKA
jgi:dephospho-CoA kinase